MSSRQAACMAFSVLSSGAVVGDGEASLCPGLACDWEMPEMNEETGAGDGLEPAINPAINTTVSARVRLQARTGSTNGVRSKGNAGKTGRAASSGHPVFGRVAATTPKHSV